MDEKKVILKVAGNMLPKDEEFEQPKAEDQEETSHER